MPIGGRDFGLQKLGIEGLKRFSRVCVHSRCQQQNANHTGGEFQHAITCSGTAAGLSHISRVLELDIQRAGRMNARSPLLSYRLNHEYITPTVVATILLGAGQSIAGIPNLQPID
jgi:hypothetical protein